MGCICSKGGTVDEFVDNNEKEKKEKEKELNKDSVQLVAPSTGEEFVMGPGGGSVHGRAGGSVHPVPKSALPSNVGSAPINAMEGEKKAMTVDRHAQTSHQRRLTLDMEDDVGPSPKSRIVSMPNGARGEQIVAGWPSWLSSVAGEAIQGWVPLRPDSYEKLDKVSSYLASFLLSLSMQFIFYLIMFRLISVCMILVSFRILPVISVVQDFDNFFCHDGLEILNDVLCFMLSVNSF